MKNLLIVLMLLLTGCVAVSPEVVTTKEPTSVKRVVPVAPCTALELLEYYQRLRGLSAAELVKEQNLLNQQATQPRTDAWLVQQALLQSVAHGPNDLSRSLVSLDAVVKNKEPANVSIRQLAVLLYSLIAEQKRLEDQNEKASAQLREDQRQLETMAAKQAALQDKLDGLKAIERSLLNRPQGNKP